ncbi:FAD-dependent oxidoreductase [Micromonospora sp. 4G55]|uniref:FAD-dependent oxidoreductase n=1 Tax=Micromonospora sp. 4G55 TaxID=2806102 RepID=UPI001EE3E13F|nr:FAD-dependent oxidoreductase [Micromonospora sp. 4G55]
MNASISDVTVVGSGLLGLSAAFELLERGLSVTVIGPRTGGHVGRHPGPPGRC